MAIHEGNQASIEWSLNCRKVIQTLSRFGREMAARVLLLTALTYIISTSTFVDSEIFTALSHVERLINIEMELSDALEDYIAEQESRLKKLRSFSEDVKSAMGRAVSNRDQYIGHPVNTYQMIKRLVKEWTQHVKSIEEEGDAEGKTHVMQCLKHWHI